MLTETEKKALALVTQLQEEDDGKKYSYAYHFEALLRAIEQHEAFRQEVSDAIDSSVLTPETEAHLARFIIAKPDLLVEAWLEAFPGNHIDDAREECAKISAALAARGLTITETKEQN